jgi:hypothetical protein
MPDALTRMPVDALGCRLIQQQETSCFWHNSDRPACPLSGRYPGGSGLRAHMPKST